MAAGGEHRRTYVRRPGEETRNSAAKKETPIDMVDFVISSSIAGARAERQLVCFFPILHADRVHSADRTCRGN